MKVMTTLYMEEELKRQAEEYAKITERTLSALIRYVLQKELNEVNKQLEREKILEYSQDYEKEEGKNV